MGNSVIVDMGVLKVTDCVKCRLHQVNDELKKCHRSDKLDVKPLTAIILGFLQLPSKALPSVDEQHLA